MIGRLGSSDGRPTVEQPGQVTRDKLPTACAHQAAVLRQPPVRVGLRVRGEEAVDDHREHRHLGVRTAR